MLTDLLLKERALILKRWSDLILETYPPDSCMFFKTSTDRFQNPVGTATTEGIEKLFDALVAGVDTRSSEIAAIVDNIVRIRAVQDFSPSAAVEFIFLLKRVVRELFAEYIAEKQFVDTLLDFESRIDNMALVTFNVYMGCRERIFEIRTMELRNHTSKVLELACRKFGIPRE